MAMVKRLTPQFVDTFPAVMDVGVLYVSIEFATCGHLCACGCGNETMTPLSPAQWAFTYDGKDVSLRPSIGNWALPCQSHYVLDRGRIRWARQFSDTEIQSNRHRDRIALSDGHQDASWRNDSQSLEAATPEPHDTPQVPPGSAAPSAGLWTRILRRYRLRP